MINVITSIGLTERWGRSRGQYPSTVDDSRVIRKVARKILESMSFACEEAENGQLALDACKLGMPMCILLDWNMPVMNGLEFLVALRQLPEGATPKVIFCTTENDLEKFKPP